jgi:FlaG/FlaF family flagellin (archaellin)
LRVIRVVLVVAAVAAAFVLGHVTAPPQIAQAQTPVPAASAVLSDLRCYGAQFGPQVPAQVSLRDQFQTTELTVTAPEFFCVPVVKTVLRQKTATVDGAADRMICYYAPGGTAYAQSHTATSALGKLTVSNFVPRILCVAAHQDA